MTTGVKNRLVPASLALLFCGLFAAPLLTQASPIQGAAPTAAVPGKRLGGRHAGLTFVLLKNYLDLTPTQQTQIRDILKQSHEQAKQERQFANGDKTGLKQLRRARVEKTIDQIRAVLTPEQIQKLDKVRDEVKLGKAGRPA